MAALQTYVRDIGRGLVMVGGPDSYGAGGYTKTPLEESLPVDMGVRDRQKEPDIALVVVIDQSGSMDACHCNSFDRSMGSQINGVKKVDIGKEAILRAVSAMTPRDQLGVVGFNEAAHWAIHTAPLGTEGDIASQIAGIQPGGQTNIFAGLDEAVKSLEGTAAARRHIILFTDGWSTSGAYDQIIARMKADGITLSTIGAGGGSAPVLADLAKRGGGRYYPAPNPASIPDIFLKETQQVSGQQIVEEAFHPIQTGDSPILRGITAGFPTLLGYNGTTAKSAAQTVLVTGRDDPLLAQWQYGLGRSVAWTSDTTGHWAKDWIGWTGFSRFFSQLVSWTFPGEETGGIEARFDTQGSKTTLHVESVGADGSPRDFYSTTATIVAPDLTSVQVTLPQVAPGVYETTLGEIDPGAYAIRLTQTKPGTSPLGRTVGLVAPDGRRVPLARPERAAARVDPVGDRGHGRGRPARRLAARPRHHLDVHRPVAGPARPGDAPVAARRRPAARVGRPSRARARPCLDPGVAGPAATGGPAHRRRGGAHRRPGARLGLGRPGRHARGAGQWRGSRAGRRSGRGSARRTGRCPDHASSARRGASHPGSVAGRWRGRVGRPGRSGRPGQGSGPRPGSRPRDDRATPRGQAPHSRALTAVPSEHRSPLAPAPVSVTRRHRSPPHLTQSPRPRAPSRPVDHRPSPRDRRRERERTVAIDSQKPASRRSVLAASLGALGGLAAARLGQPDDVAAAQCGDPRRERRLQPGHDPDPGGEHHRCSRRDLARRPSRGERHGPRRRLRQRDRRPRHERDGDRPAGGQHGRHPDARLQRRLQQDGRHRDGRRPRDARDRTG